jgi:hypothetical protein
MSIAEQPTVPCRLAARNQRRSITDDTSRISRSMLKAFDESRKVYYETFVAKTRPRKPPTPAMQLGTHLHTAVLEPEKWESSTIVPPKCDKRTKDGQGDLGTDFAKRSRPAKPSFTEEQDDAVNRMRDGDPQLPEGDAAARR